MKCRECGGDGQVPDLTRFLAWKDCPSCDGGRTVAVAETLGWSTCTRVEMNRDRTEAAWYRGNAEFSRCSMDGVYADDEARARAWCSEMVMMGYAVSTRWPVGAASVRKGEWERLRRYREQRDMETGGAPW